MGVDFGKAVEYRYGFSPIEVMQFTYLSDSNAIPSVHFFSAAMRCALIAELGPGAGLWVSTWAKTCEAKSVTESPEASATTSFFMFVSSSPKAMFSGRHRESRKWNDNVPCSRRTANPNPAPSFRARSQLACFAMSQR